MGKRCRRTAPLNVCFRCFAIAIKETKSRIFIAGDIAKIYVFKIFNSQIVDLEESRVYLRIMLQRQRKAHDACEAAVGLRGFHSWTD